MKKPKYAVTVVTNGVSKVYNVYAFGISPWKITLIFSMLPAVVVKIRLFLGMSPGVKMKVINLRKDVSEILINPKPAGLDLLELNSVLRKRTESA